jgi:predicted RNA-binding Zn ribbon-like protein
MSLTLAAAGTTASPLARALNLAVFTLPLVMAAGAFVRAPRLAAAPVSVALSCAAPVAVSAPAVVAPPRASRLAALAAEGCRETPAH